MRVKIHLVELMRQSVLSTLPKFVVPTVAVDNFAAVLGTVRLASPIQAYDHTALEPSELPVLPK